MTDFTPWTARDAAGFIAVPDERSDKYSRGVLGVVTGSDQYPGAAVLGVEAALRTGVGMVRYLGPHRATDLVLQRRPEAVASDGRVQAWLLGSGMDPVHRDTTVMERALAQGLPVVLDGGAPDLRRRATGPVGPTPHHGKPAPLRGCARRADPGFPPPGGPGGGAGPPVRGGSRLPGTGRGWSGPWRRAPRGFWTGGPPPCADGRPARSC